MSEHWPPGPTRRDLEAIDAEWPLIEAEVSLVDAEAAIARADQGVSELDRRRLRRAQARVERCARDLSNRGGPLDGAA